MKRNIIILVILGIVMVLLVAILTTERQQEGFQNQTEVVRENLDTPWDIQFAGEEMFVTERAGRLRIFNGNKETTIQVPNVFENGESGLLGLALHPDFAQNRLVYFYQTVIQGSEPKNIILQHKLTNNRLEERKVILEDIPAASIHDGGRIAFGPDGLLYVTTGDAGNEDQAQEINSLAGKILRMTDEGVVPADNPFNNYVYAFGLRNPQGLAWDNENRLWATDHGSSAQDELNLIEIGKNYGWPIIRGGETREGMETPKINSGQETWAPAGLAFQNGKLYFAGLRGMALFEVQIEGTNVRLNRPSSNNFGRLRAVRTKEDDIYFSTSNRDGRGFPQPGDDKIIRANLR